MKNFILSGLTALLVLFVLISAKPPACQTYQYNYENVLGTSFELKMMAISEERADHAEQLALDEIDRLNNILSTYNTNSEIGRWLKSYQTEEKISAELLEVFTLFDQWRTKTKGALNASAAIASNIWKAAALKQQMPEENELAQAVDLMNQPHWEIDIQRQTATHLSHQPWC